MKTSLGKHISMFFLNVGLICLFPCNIIVILQWEDMPLLASGICNYGTVLCLEPAVHPLHSHATLQWWSHSSQECFKYITASKQFLDLQRQNSLPKKKIIHTENREKSVWRSNAVLCITWVDFYEKTSQNTEWSKTKIVQKKLLDL